MFYKSLEHKARCNAECRRYAKTHRVERNAYYCRHRSEHKEQYRTRERDYEEKNRETIRTRKKKHREENIEAFKLRDRIHYLFVRENIRKSKLLGMANSVCHVCGETDTDMLDRHHLVHKKDGGEKVLENLILLCRNHHQKEHAKSWKRQCKRTKKAKELLDGKECVVCGEKDRDMLHSHHVMFESWGGKDDIENRVVLCGNHHVKVHRIFSRLWPLFHMAFMSNPILFRRDSVEVDEDAVTGPHISSDNDIRRQAAVNAA